VTDTQVSFTPAAEDLAKAGLVTVQTVTADGTISGAGTLHVSDLAITEDTLGNVTANADVQTQLHVTGGQSPYVWEAAGLPKGLKIDEKNALISGKTAQAGTQDVSVTVTDKNGAQARKSYKLTVSP
jgi:hypothetical protein